LGSLGGLLGSRLSLLGSLRSTTGSRTLHGLGSSLLLLTTSARGGTSSSSSSFGSRWHFIYYLNKKKLNFAKIMN
jgi:hypothetical protein